MSIIPIPPSRAEQLYRVATAGIALLVLLSLGIL
jgi:hypothetical protein